MENPKESKKILLHMSGCLLVSMLLDGMNQWVLARGSLLTKAFWIKGMPTRLRKGVPGKSPGFVHNPGASANGLLKIDCERWPQNKKFNWLFCGVLLVRVWIGVGLGWGLPGVGMKWDRLVTLGNALGCECGFVRGGVCVCVCVRVCVSLTCV